MLALVTGGARSGKSRFAEQYASRLGRNGTYVATSQLFDEEMRERVAKHRQERQNAAFPWHTIEEPYDLPGLLHRLFEQGQDQGREQEHRKEREPIQEAGPCVSGTGAPAHNQPLLQQQRREAPGVVLVDCLTLWLSNVLLRECGEEADFDASAAAASADRQIDRLAATLRGLPREAHVLLVTNEVGSGIVPEYPLGRLYRDLAGQLNQRIAAVCDQVFLVTAGIPVELKSIAFRLPEPLEAAEGGRQSHVDVYD